MSDRIKKPTRTPRRIIETPRARHVAAAAALERRRKPSGIIASPQTRQDADAAALERLRTEPPQPSGRALLAEHLATLEEIAKDADRRKGCGRKIRREISEITVIVRDHFSERFRGVRLRERAPCEACGMLGAVFFRCTECDGLLCDNCRNMKSNGGRPVCARCQEAGK
jgi:hypothetical protein